MIGLLFYRKKIITFSTQCWVSFIPTLAFEGLKSKTLNYLKLSANIVKVGNSSSIQPYATPR
jgi:hypothetical protein